MGFKINYYPQVIALVAVLTISINANANIPQHDVIGDIIKQNNYTAPVPTLQIQEPPLEIKPVDQKELYCLAEAVYFESKNESLKGQKAVAHVIVNRSKSYKFPSTICRVINQKNHSTCQFSYKCEGKALVPKNKNDFAIAVKVAEDILEGERDNTNGALFFHNNTVRPLWAKAYKMTTIIGNHKFYRG
jgi:spore germination cell wall hydrolase CwlJ-like protein